MPFKRLQARGVPLLRPFKKIGLAGMRRWVPRRFLQLSNTAVIGHKPASEDTSVSLVHWQEPYSHRGRVPADCSQLPGLRRLPGSLPDHRASDHRTIEENPSPSRRGSPTSCISPRRCASPSTTSWTFWTSAASVRSFPGASRSASSPSLVSARAALSILGQW